MTHPAEDSYRVGTWGEGVFGVSEKGHLTVQIGDATIDLAEASAAVVTKGRLPVVLRFPQLVAARIERLNSAFQSAIANAGVTARYRGVFPIKVNQRRELVQALLRAGKRWSHGLEVGSKAELLAALAMDPDPESLLIVNGFKDRAFLEAACHASLLKPNLVVVLDEMGEVTRLLSVTSPMPQLGIRLKLRHSAPGKWALSGGARSKFGLTIPEVLDAVQKLDGAGVLDRVKVLHFHIGSQISDIRRIVGSVREAARVYAGLVQMGVPLQYLDVGGGLAIDYDGTGSSGPNSANYTMEEYAAAVTVTLRDVCEEEEVPVPDIINEAGRAVVAHHAVLIMDVVRRTPGAQLGEPKPDDDDPTPLVNLFGAYAGLGPTNVFETFHDAMVHRDDIQALFDLGHLSLEALGRAEETFRSLVVRTRELLEAEGETGSEEYTQAMLAESRRLVCNFSLFQSLPDVWGVKQQFPVVPIHRLLEPPSEFASIADITCDSDGEIRRFISANGTSPTIPIHAPREGEAYLLAVALVGAYQDTLGDYHNLFGETDEAWIVANGSGWRIDRMVRGSRVADMLEWVRYRGSDVRKRLRTRVRKAQEAGDLSEADAKALESRLSTLLDASTYLETD